MNPIKFEQCNTLFGPPAELSESQCRSIHAYCGLVSGGSCDGAGQVVVAYQLSEEERKRLAEGGLLYISMIGGLAPHYPSLSFEEATHPA